MAMLGDHPWQEGVNKHLNPQEKASAFVGAFLFCSFAANIVGLVIALLYFGALLTDWHDTTAKQHTK